MTQILIRFLKVVSLFSLLSLGVGGCQTTTFKNLETKDNSGANSTTKNDEQSLDLSSIAKKFFSTAFATEETPVTQASNDDTDTSQKIEEYNTFNQINTSENIRKAINNSDKVRAAIENLESLKADVGAAQASQAFSSDIRAVGGLLSENRDTDLGASVRLSGNKTIYDGDSTDYRIKAGESQLEAGKKAVLIAANQAALAAFEAWIDVVRFKKINQFYLEGLAKGETILKQIESVSMSGLSDKKGLLSSTRDMLELKNNYIATQALEQTALATFLNAFSAPDALNIVESPIIDFETSKLGEANVVLGGLALEQNNLLQQSLESQKKALEGGKKPAVAFQTSINAPAKDTLDDGTAQAGFIVNYVFNDGGMVDYQIQRVSAQLSILKFQTNELRKSLSFQYQTAKIYYNSSKAKVVATKGLLEISQEIYLTAKQQVVSGRSTIAEILDAEMRVAKLEIELINAEADKEKALVQMKALTGGLHDVVDWSL